MVTGGGMVAKKFSPYADDERYLVFASGISNSKLTDPSAYQREKDLLEKTIREHPDKILVYFSTCSIYDPAEGNSRYVQHKKEVEAYVSRIAKRYYLLRVSNLVGHSSNPNTILNYFVHHIMQEIQFDLWTGATRNLLDIDDMYTIVDRVLHDKQLENQVINIANPRNYRVTEIIRAIEKETGKDAMYVANRKGEAFTIDTATIQPIIETENINFDDDYLGRLIRKYYPPQ